MDLEEIKKLFDQDYTHNQTTRRKAADDRLFSRVTQWDDTLLESTQLAYKGEFNILRKATRDILSDLRSNPVQIDFEPKADSRSDGADLLDGLYLTDDRMNVSIESYDNGCEESVDCGIGGWELYTEYESSRSGERHQVIRRRPIYEFNNNAFPDCNAKLLDKSDAKRWTILEPYTKEGYQELYKELTGEETNAAPADFAAPEQSYVFPWVTGNETYYIARFYHKKRIKDKVLTLVDPLGQPLKLLESNLMEVMDEMIDQGYEISETKEIQRWQVTCYICSGERILKEYEVAGEHIPVIPIYGERGFVEGEEVYEGVIRLGKDPQRLRNFLMSYLGDIAARSPRKKPIFGAEQIAGYEFMYEENGPDNNYPYLLQKLKGANGEEMPLGPVGSIDPPDIPPAVGALVELSRQAVEDVANEGLPDDISDVDLSGRAVELIQHRLDRQSFIYQDHLKHAKRYDARVYASMATVIYDAPRKVTVTLPDGSRKTEEIMQSVMDRQTGELVVLNDLTNMEFEVYAKIGPSYNSQREKTFDLLGEMAQQVQQADPTFFKALMLKRLQLIDGANLEDIKEYANKQLLLMGFRQPETEEEVQFLQKAMSQPKQPDPNMVLAQGELLKGQAALMREKREAQKDQWDNENEDAGLQVDAFRAETERMDVMAKAKRYGADIELNKAKIKNLDVDNVVKLTAPFRARVNEQRKSA